MTSLPSRRLSSVPSLLRATGTSRKACRNVHTSQTSRATPLTYGHAPDVALAEHVRSPPVQEIPLARLPLSDLLRSWFMSSITSRPLTLKACSFLMLRMLASNNVLFDLNRNPVLHSILRNTFYKHYCTGTNRKEMQETIEKLRGIGYSGIILEYTLELLDGDKSAALSGTAAIEKWKKGMLESIDITVPGDFVGFKWSGMGVDAFDLLSQNQAPSSEMERAMKEVCSLAASKGVMLLPGAEEAKVNRGLQSWSMKMQKIFNKNEDEKAVVYHTYQAYLKATPQHVSEALGFAQENDFTLGVKLVRGAYLASEPRQLLHNSKEDTHDCYDGIAEQLLRQKFGGIVQPLAGKSAVFPRLNIVLATHNDISLQKAQAIRNEQLAAGEPLVPAKYAQLQGMADELSCSLLQRNPLTMGTTFGQIDPAQPQVYKCTVWGSMEDCLNFLLRRAEENKEAAERTLQTRKCMATEIRRRSWAQLGL